MEVADGVCRLFPRVGVKELRGDVHHAIPVAGGLGLAIELGGLRLVPQAVSGQSGCREPRKQTVGLPGDQLRPPFRRADRRAVRIAQHELQPLKRLVPMPRGDQLLGMFELLGLRRVVRHAAVDIVAGAAAVAEAPASSESVLGRPFSGSLSLSLGLSPSTSRKSRERGFGEAAPGGGGAACLRVAERRPKGRLFAFWAQARP